MDNSEPESIHKNALVLLSGGQDSTVCLAWALNNCDLVETVGFSYGQRHKVELSGRNLIREKITSLPNKWRGVLGSDFLIKLSDFGKISSSALVNTEKIVINSAQLPNTFVPGRNLIFLTYAAAICYERGISTIIGGMCETDYSGYPDCRKETIDAMEKTLSLGMETSLKIITPLMFLTKQDVWALAEKLGGNSLVNLIVENTTTCYLGDRKNKHSWGYGCNKCPACVLRRDGFLKFISSKKK